MVNSFLILIYPLSLPLVCDVVVKPLRTTCFVIAEIEFFWATVSSYDERSGVTE